MGFCGHIGATWADTPADYVNALTYVGAKIMREDVKWARVEATLGNYAFPGVNTELLRLDSAMTLAQAQGIETLAILDYGNSLYGPDSPAGYKGGLPLTAGERTAYANYAAFMAGALAGRPVEYELWNEWNVPLGATAAQQAANEHVDPAKYYALQEVVYPAFKAANPDAFMWAGGFAEPMDVRPTRNEWIDGYLSIPGWETTTDGFSFHHYFDFTRPERWFWQVRGTVALARAAAATKPNIPVALTESGWFNGGDPQNVSETTAADYYSRWPFMLRCTGVSKATFYDLRNDGAGTTKEENFGVFTTTYTPKQAATVLADVLPLVQAATASEYWTDGTRHVVVLDTGIVALWVAPIVTSALTIRISAASAGTATIRTAGDVTSNIALSAGANDIAVDLASRAKILVLPAGASFVSVS